MKEASLDKGWMFDTNFASFISTHTNFGLDIV